MTMAFKWTEEELSKVADSMYKLMAKHGSSYDDYWSAFKYAQAIVNPVYKYSTAFANTKLMKELRRRIAQIFADCRNKVEVKVVLDATSARSKAADIMRKIGGKLSPERKQEVSDAQIAALDKAIQAIRAKKDAPKTRKLLTGNTVENLDHQVTISITTMCPKKWVLVDLETGDQYGSPGILTTQEMLRVEPRQTWTNPVRKVTIPKPRKKSKSNFDEKEFKRTSL